MSDVRRNQPPRGPNAVEVAETLDADVVGARGGRPPSDLGPKFSIIGVIGRGAMGVVLRVRHTELDKVMAVKVMAAGVLSRAQSLRLWREARALSDLAHPNIVRVHDLDRAPDGTPFIVMELLEGRTVEEEFEQRAPLAPRRVVELLRGVADALDSAHAAGVVHRDLKPLNLFLTRDGVVKVLDFGICHYEVGDIRATHAGGVVGTPMYMAPEQLRGETPQPQTDVYALACIAWQALTGRPPLAGVSFERLSHPDGPPAPPHLDEIRPGLPPALSGVFDRALALRPEDRHPSAGAFLAALDRACGGDPSSGRFAAPLLGTTPTATAPDRAGDRAPTRGARPFARFAPFALLAITLAVVVRILVGGPNSEPADGKSTPSGADSPTGSPSATSRATAEPPLRWPQDVRLLVLPFRSESPARALDGRLWPVVDRLVVNALGADQREYGRLERVDPAIVEREIERRELGLTLEPEEVIELAAVLRATVVLEGTVERIGGFVRLSASLHPAGGRGAVPLRVEHVHLLAAASQLADDVRGALWGTAAPDPPDAARLSQLLVSRREAASALAAADGLVGRAERDALYERALASDPAAAGAAWRRYLENVADPNRRAALAEVAAPLADPELRRFFDSVAKDGEGAMACAGVDARALGARYPITLGPLCGAVCNYLRGDWAEATRLATLAFDDVALRPLAQPLLSKLLFLARTCDEVLPALSHVQRLSPEEVRGWAVLASWHARCGDMDEARRLVDVARALLGDDPDTIRRVAYNAAWVHLVDLDVDGAWEWLARLEKNRVLDEPDGGYYFITSLALHMQGRPDEARSVVAQGVETFRAKRDNVYTMLVASTFYSALAVGRLDDARSLAETFAGVFADPAEVGDHYMAQMLLLAVDAAEGKVAPGEIEQRMAAIGAPIEAALGDLGRDERAAQECVLATYLRRADVAEAVLGRASPSNKLLGGCRFLHARGLLDAGHPAEAAEQFRRALREIIWARFVYGEFVAPAMLGHGRALEAAGRTEEARAAYEQILTNYAHSEDVLPESLAAAEALARLTR